jgi:hypothetical protein
LTLESLYAKRANTGIKMDFPEWEDVKNVAVLLENCMFQVPNAQTILQGGTKLMFPSLCFDTWFALSHDFFAIITHAPKYFFFLSSIKIYHYYSFFNIIAHPTQRRSSQVGSRNKLFFG